MSDRPSGTGTDHVPSPGAVSYERSPVDVLRLVVGLVCLVAVLLVIALFGNAFVEFLYDLLRGVDALPSWLLSTIVVASRVLVSALVIGGVVIAVLHRRWHPLLTAAGAAIAAVVVFLIVDALVHEETSSLVDIGVELGPLTHDQFPSAAGLAAIAAVVTATAPWLPRPWRRLTWTTLVVVALARLITAPVSLDGLVALLVGWVVGSAMLVVIGGPVRRPGEAEIVEGLAAVGLPIATISKAKVDARGSTPYFATAEDGSKLFVKVLGVDQRSADLLFRTYRKLIPHDLGDEKADASLRRAVEHEALVALTARDVGVRTPRVRAFSRVGPDGFVLAYEGIEGTSLDGVPPEQFDDELVRGVWNQIKILRRHGIAHRDLRLANVFRASDGEILLIDFGFSELAASDVLLATDLAELLGSLSLVIGADRAVEAGRAAVGPEALATAAPRLHPFALSGATRTGMKAHPGLLDGLREQVSATAGATVSREPR